jgi:hypothetical protein
MNARLVGVRKKKAEAAEKEDKKWGTFYACFNWQAMMNYHVVLHWNAIIFSWIDGL